MGKGTVKAILEDWRTAPVRPQVRATLGFIEKLIKGPPPTPADAAEVLATGVSRDGLARAAQIVSTFTILTKMADTFGWQLLEEGGYDAGAKMLLKRGYVL